MVYWGADFGLIHVSSRGSNSSLLNVNKEDIFFTVIESIGFCFSFVKYQGMTFREVSCEIIKWAILRPRRRVYKTENIYDYIKK